MEKSRYTKKEKADIIDEIFSEIEKDIAQDLSFTTNRKDDFNAAIHRIFIEEKAYRDPALTRDSLIKRMDMGKEIFIQQFHDRFGISFRECINKLRLKEAVILLEQSDLTIGKIADKVGFDTTRTFQRQFMEKYGKPPKDYRKSKQG